MTFDPKSVGATCVTLRKDHCVQVPWEYINICGYSDLLHDPEFNQHYYYNFSNVLYTWLCVEKILQSRSFQNIDKTCSKKELILEYSTQISILPFPGTGTIGLLCEQEVQWAWLLSNIADSGRENPLVLISALFIEHLYWIMIG